MRDYLYIFNDPENKCIFASGIEFKDIAKQLECDGLYLLKHGCQKGVSLDLQSRFEYIDASEIKALVKEDIYSWGDFFWVDFTGTPSFPLQDRTISELLFFTHIFKPLDRSTFDEMQNKFLCGIHDDGWLLKLYYKDWSDIDDLLRNVIQTLGVDIDIIPGIKDGKNAFWVNSGRIEQCAKTYDPDEVLNEKYN